MSGVFLELIVIAVFLALVAFLCWDAGLKVSRNLLVLLGIIIVAFFSFLTIYEW